MKSPQPYLDELQQRQENKSMLQIRSSFGKSTTTKPIEEIPLERGVKLVQNDGVADTILRQPSVTLHDLVKEASSTNDKVSVGVLLPVSSSQRQESTSSSTTTATSSSEFDGSVLSSDESASNNSFSLGLYDSDSSLLEPSKLYGREKEVKKLTEAYQRTIQRNSPASPLEYILISGGVGTGKTRLGESLRQKVEADGGFFCYGKFDQFNMAHPLAPFCAVFTDYVEQVLMCDETIKNEARHRIRAALDGEMAEVCGMIPPLAKLMDVPNVCPNGVKDHTQNHHHHSASEEEKRETEGNDESDCKCRGQRMFAMQRLMRALSTPERPVVMMLDDLQWAKRAALDKIRSMVTDDMNYGIVFVGVCYNDVSPTSDLSTMLRIIEDDGVQITNIGLKNLNLDSVINMTNDAFVMEEEQATALGKYIMENNFGNPYLVLESLKAIQQTPGLMHYDNESETWMMNIKACCHTGCCPVNYIESRLRAVPRDVQKVFMVCSCLGSNITPRLVEISLQEDAQERFDKLVKKGKFNFDKVNRTYSFKSNAVQEASYRLIDESIRPGFHLEVGMRLWKNLDESEVEDNLFVIVDQIRRGVSLIKDQSTKYELIRLIIRAATKAVGLFNFQCGSDLLRFALSLLGKKHWKKAYDLSLTLYNYAAEVEFALGDSDRVDELIDSVLKNARNFDDQIRAYSTRLYVLGGRGDTKQSIELGTFILEKFDIHLPKHSHKCKWNDLKTALAMGRISKRLNGMSNERIKRMPHMTDPNKLAAMQILNLLFKSTKVSKRTDLFPFIVMKMMKLTLTDGLSAISSVAFAGYGSLLCYFGNVNEGLRFGRLALDLVEDFDAVSFKSRVDAIVWGEIYPHVRSWTESLKELKEGHRIGLQTGDIAFAMTNADMYALFLLESGSVGMRDMVKDISEVTEATKLHGHTQKIGILKPMLSALELFSNPQGDITKHPSQLDEGLQAATENQNLFAASVLSVTKEVLYFIAEDYDSALEMMQRRNDCGCRIEGSIQETFAYFLEGLVAFAAMREKKGLERRRLYKIARDCMRHLKFLSKNNPSICLSKYMLLEAEDAAMRKKFCIAQEKYKSAISLAKNNSAFFDVAFGNQVAASHFLHDVHDIDSALDYYRATRKTYEDCQAPAASKVFTMKIEDLSKRYSWSNGQD